MKLADLIKGCVVVFFPLFLSLSVSVLHLPDDQNPLSVSTVSLSFFARVHP